MKTLFKLTMAVVVIVTIVSSTMIIVDDLMGYDSVAYSSQLDSIK